MPAVFKTGRIAWVTLIGLTSLLVLMLAWPRFLASFRYLPVEIAIKKYFSDREIPSERLPVLIRFTEEALDYNDHYRFHDGLSFLHSLRAMDVNTPVGERRASYQLSLEEAERSLQAAPAQPELWMRLARLRWILREEPEQVLAAWKMSVFTGRATYTLITQRIEIGLAYHALLDDEARMMLRDQLMLGWRMQPGTLIQMLAARDQDLIVTRSLIESSNPEALTEMEEWIARFR